MSELAKTSPTWQDCIWKVESKFSEIANRQKLVVWAEESQFALQAIQKNQKLAGCLVNTVQNAIINVAAVGLTLNPALGYAYLVPEAVKQPDQKYANECFLRISFKGLLKVANDSGSIKWAKAEIVKEKDVFTYRGPCQIPDHDMKPFSGDRGNTVGVYCVAMTHDGTPLVDLMDSAEIVKIRNAAKTKNVWDSWPDEMAKKSIIKRASKQWPKTDIYDRLDMAVAALNEYEGSEFIDVGKNDAETIDVEQVMDLANKINKNKDLENKILAYAGAESLHQIPVGMYETIQKRLDKTLAKPKELSNGA